MSAGPGSELNVPRFEAAGVRFVRTDVPCADVKALEHVDAIVERSAETSVPVGSTTYAPTPCRRISLGAYNCATLARRDTRPLDEPRLSVVLSVRRLDGVDPEDEGVQRGGIVPVNAAQGLVLAPAERRLADVGEPSIG